MTPVIQLDAPEARSAMNRPMRLLFVSYWFPPTNAIGAVRAGKFAKYMRESATRSASSPARPARR